MCETTDIEPHPSRAGLDADDVDGLRGQHRSWGGPGVGFGCAEAHSVCHVCCACAAL